MEASGMTGGGSSSRATSPFDERNEKQLDNERIDLVGHFEKKGIDLPISTFETMLTDAPKSPVFHTKSLADSSTASDKSEEGGLQTEKGVADEEHLEWNKSNEDEEDLEDVVMRDHPNDETVVFPPYSNDERMKRSFPFFLPRARADTSIENPPAIEVRFTDVTKPSLMDYEDHRRRVYWTLVLFCITLFAVMAGLFIGAYGLNGKKQDDSLPRETHFAAASAASGQAVGKNYVDPRDWMHSSAENAVECEGDIISTNSWCYEWGKQILISFENCNPLDDDWLAIYTSDANPSDLGDPLSWMWTCGNQSCRGEVRADVLAFADYLDPGLYRAHLVRRNSGGPYASYAISSEFVISSDSMGCEGGA